MNKTSIKKFIKKVLPSSIIKKINEYKEFKRCSKRLKVKNGKPVAFLLNTPEYGNLGDAAIALSAKNLLQEFLGDKYNVVEFTRTEIERYLSVLLNRIKATDIVFLPGGGNLGDLWYIHECERLKIIEALGSNLVVSLPQSMFFSSSIEGGQKLEHSRKIYSQHKTLIMCARDQNSFEEMSKKLSCEVKLLPDSVLCLDYSEYWSETKRENVLLCLREDKEKSLNKTVVAEISEMLTSKYPIIEQTDMMTTKAVLVATRQEEVEKKLKEMSSYNLVITDRLHGMIFCAITGTPCIVFDNSYHKVFSQYEWIKHLEYIKPVVSIEQFEQALNDLDLNKKYEYDNAFAKQYYFELFTSIAEDKTK